MTPKEIATKAERLRKEGIDMGNYQRVVTSAFSMIRDLALIVENLVPEDVHKNLKKGHPKLEEDSVDEDEL